MQNVPREVQLSTSSMRTTLRLQNSVHIQRPAKFRIERVCNGNYLLTVLSGYHNNKVPRRKSLLYAQYIGILLITCVRATKNLILCDNQPL